MLAAVSALFLFPSARRRDSAVDAWFLAPDRELRRTVQPWFETIRACGPDVRDLLHDGCPTACVGEAAFAYVNAFQAHAAVGFYFGAALPDPGSLLEGTGKRMRHVKVRWGEPPNAADMNGLIAAAYSDMRARLAAEGRG
jgi:hypothetical protein